MPTLSRRRTWPPTHGSLYVPAGGGGGGFTAAGVHFDGATEYFRNAGGFGNSNSKQGTVSMWVNVAANGAIFGWQNSGFSASGFSVRSQNQFILFKLFDPAGVGEIGTISPNSGFGSGGGIPPDSTAYDWRTLGWRWLAFSWDLASTARMQCASNVYTTAGSLDLFDGSSITDNTVSYPATGYPTIGSFGFGNSPYTGDLAEFIFFSGTSLDLSNSTVRAKFISASGHPVDLGTTGNIPTGSNPTFYFKGPAAGFGTNAAGTGDMIVGSGAVTDSSTNP